MKRKKERKKERNTKTRCLCNEWINPCEWLIMSCLKTPPFLELLCHKEHMAENATAGLLASSDNSLVVTLPWLLQLHVSLSINSSIAATCVVIRFWLNQYLAHLLQCHVTPDYAIWTHRTALYLGRLKSRELTSRDLTTRHQIAWSVNARLDNARPSSTGGHRETACCRRRRSCTLMPRSKWCRRFIISCFFFCSSPSLISRFQCVTRWCHGRRPNCT